MSKEEFEWRCAEYDRVRKRMPQALHELRILADDMYLHFGGDFHALRKWDEYAKSVHDSFAGFLQDSLASPLNTPNSVLYAQLMKREAHKRSFAGRLDRLKNAAAAMSKRIGRAEAMMAAGILGLTVGSTLTLLWTKQQETKET
ncbi:hypothetical protein E2562_020596 [Oryza meyeriana var. granulata]|nr:hypothetical protein E2562_020596 [Oryza meyeriana var. granulata]